MWTWLDMSPNWCEWQQDARGKVMQFNLCLNSARTFFYPVSCCTKSGLMCALCVPGEPLQLCVANFMAWLCRWAEAEKRCAALGMRFSTGEL